MEQKHPMIDATWYENDDNDLTVSGENDIDKERLKTFKPITDYQYVWNQAWNNKTTHFCSAFAPMCIILSYKEKTRGDKEWEYFFDRAAEHYGYKPKQGNSLRTGLKCAIDFWNTMHPDDPLMYYNVKWNTPEMFYALSLGYRLLVGGSFNKYYGLDKRYDRIINKVKTWINKSSTYGHAFTVVDNDVNDSVLNHIDNYKGTKFNYYDIEKNVMKEASYNYVSGVGYFSGVFVITSAKDYSRNELGFEWSKKLKLLMQVRSKFWNDINKDLSIDKKISKKIQDQLHSENNWYRDNFKL